MKNLQKKSFMKRRSLLVTIWSGIATANCCPISTQQMLPILLRRFSSARISWVAFNLKVSINLVKRERKSEKWSYKIVWPAIISHYDYADSDDFIPRWFGRRSFKVKILFHNWKGEELKAITSAGGLFLREREKFARHCDEDVRINESSRCVL